MGGAYKALVGITVIGALIALFGFSPDPPRELQERLAQEKRDGDALMKSADDLEDRLLGTQANLELWQEMERRHKSVSAIVVQNHGEHFDEMVRLLDAQQEKARRLRRGQSVASTGPRLTGAMASSHRVRHPKED